MKKQRWNGIRKLNEKEWTKDGRCWVFEITENGKSRKSKKFKTKKEAEEARYEYYIKTKEIEVENKNMTVEQLIEFHLNFQKDKIKSTTLDNYRKKNLYFNDLMKVKVVDLDINKIEKWKNQMNDRNLKTRTKNDALKYFKSILNYGSTYKDFNFNKFYGKITNFNDPNELPEEMKFYTLEQFNKFISYEDDLKYKTLFETLFYCGLRRGEIRGLCWDCIDFDNKQLTVKRNVVNVKGGQGYWELTTPKTKSSIRTIPIPNILLEDLKKLKDYNKGYYSFSDKWFVFGDINPIHPDRLRKRKNDLAEKSGLEQIRIHDFRHSCASLLINNGANITIVAKYLGHTKIDETLNTYSHMYGSELDKVVNTINNIAL